MTKQINYKKTQIGNLKVGDKFYKRNDSGIIECVVREIFADGKYCYKLNDVAFSCDATDVVRIQQPKPKKRHGLFELRSKAFDELGKDSPVVDVTAIAKSSAKLAKAFAAANGLVILFKGTELEPSSHIRRVLLVKKERWSETKWSGKFNDGVQIKEERNDGYNRHTGQRMTRTTYEFSLKGLLERIPYKFMETVTSVVIVGVDLNRRQLHAKRVEARQGRQDKTFVISVPTVKKWLGINDAQRYDSLDAFVKKLKSQDPETISTRDSLREFEKVLEQITSTPGGYYLRNNDLTHFRFDRIRKGETNYRTGEPQRRDLSTVSYELRQVIKEWRDKNANVSSQV